MGPAIILSIFGCALWLAAMHPRAAILATVFFAAWGGLEADLGLRLTAYQLFLAPIFLVTLVRSLMPGWRVGRIAADLPLVVVIVYAIIFSITQIGFIPIIQVGDSVFRGPVPRAIIQIGLFCFALSPVFLIGWTMRRSGDVGAMLTTYVVSAIVLAIIGWIQLIIWYGTGTNPLPIGAVSVLLGGSDEYVRQGFFDYGKLSIYRMNSLAGEPRNLGVALVFAMLMIQAVALTARRLPSGKLLAVWAFLLVSAAATYSTSAVFIWVIGSATLFPAAWLFGVTIRRSTVGLVTSAAIFVGLVGLAVATAEARGIPVLELLSERTIERLDSAGAVEDFDLAIIGYLTAHPESTIMGLGLGNAHLYATPYLDPLFALYAEGRVFNAKTQYLRFISEIGLVGFAMVIVWYLSLLRVASRAARADPQQSAAILIAVMAFCVFMATWQVAAEFWTIAGVLAAQAPLRVRARGFDGSAAPAMARAA